MMQSTYLGSIRGIGFLAPVIAWPLSRAVPR